MDRSAHGSCERRTRYERDSHETQRAVPSVVLGAAIFISGPPIGQFMLQQIEESVVGRAALRPSPARSHLSSTPYANSPLHLALPISLSLPPSHRVNRSCKMSPAAFPFPPPSPRPSPSLTQQLDMLSIPFGTNIRDCHAPHSLTMSQFTIRTKKNKREREESRVTYCMHAIRSPCRHPEKCVCDDRSPPLVRSLARSSQSLTLIFSSAATHDVTLCSLAPPQSLLRCSLPVEGGNEGNGREGGREGGRIGATPHFRLFV